MKMPSEELVDWQAVEATLEELADMHQKALLRLGRRIVPTLTPEDMLQPNDYPELDTHPEFRYEEGMLAGVKTAQMALRALRKRT
jgi:hypothetical protein